MFLVGRVGLEPTMFLVSRIYSPLPSPLGYLPILKAHWVELSLVLSKTLRHHLRAPKSPASCNGAS